MNPSTPSATGSRSGRGLGKLGSVLVALVVYALIRVGAGSSEPVFTAEEVADEYGIDSVKARIVAEELNAFADSAVELPRFQEAVEAAENDDEAFRSGVDSANRGLSRLPDASIDTLARLHARTLDRLSIEECARLADGSSSRSILTILDELEATEVRRLMRIRLQASLAELSKPPHPPATDAEMQEAWTGFGEALAPREVDRFVAFVETASPSAEVLCWAERTVWRLMPELDAGDKKVLLRMIAQEAGVG